MLAFPVPYIIVPIPAPIGCKGMNYKLISDEERAARKRARKQKERRRLNAKRSKQRSVQLRAEIQNQLTIEGMVAAMMELIPREPPLLLANTRESRKEVRRLEDAAYFSRWRNPTMPVQEILALPKFKDIKAPTKSVQPLETDMSARAALAIRTEAEVARLLKALGCWSPFDPQPGALALCPRCREFRLKVTLRSGDDALWQCYKCRRPACSSWPFIMERGGHALWALQNAVGRDFGGLTQDQVAAAFPEFVAEAMMSKSQHVYEGRVIDKLLQPAFGFWGLVAGGDVDGSTGCPSFPGLRPIKHKSERRDEYLVRLSWNRWGQASRLDFFTTRYKPLFRHNLGDPGEPCFEAPSWAMRRHWKGVIVTYDRTGAAMAEDQQRGLPREELIPVLLLDTGVTVEQIGLRALGRQSETGCLLAEPEVACFQSPDRIPHPPGWVGQAPPATPPLRVLFVDRDGSGLARAAAAWLSLPGFTERFAATSASTNLGRLNFGLVEAMIERGQEIGIEARQTVKSFAHAGKEFDFVVIVSNRTFLSPFLTFGGAKVIEWNFEEPPSFDAPWDMVALRCLCDSLREHVVRWGDEIRPKAPPLPQAPADTRWFDWCYPPQTTTPWQKPS